MIGSARAVIGTIALLLVFGPARIAAEEPDVRKSGSVRWVGPSGSMLATEACESVAPQDQDARPRARRGVLGWLYKYTRNVDIERAAAPRLPGFLRSPLLGALPGRTDADCNRNVARELDGPVECAVVSLNPGSDDSIIFTAPMPQLGETTVSGIEDEIQERMSRGQKVTLETSKGGRIHIRHNEGKYVSVRACRTDA